MFSGGVRGSRSVRLECFFYSFVIQLWSPLTATRFYFFTTQQIFHALCNTVTFYSITESDSCRFYAKGKERKRERKNYAALLITHENWQNSESYSHSNEKILWGIQRAAATHRPPLKILSQAARRVTLRRSSLTWLISDLNSLVITLRVQHARCQGDPSSASFFLHLTLEIIYTFWTVWSCC